MRTAFSLPDDVFERAKLLASQLGKSRSQLYVAALRSYLATYDEELLLANINSVADRIDTSLDPALRRAQAQVLLREEW